MAVMMIRVNKNSSVNPDVVAEAFLSRCAFGKGLSSKVGNTDFLMAVSGALYSGLIVSLFLFVFQVGFADFALAQEKVAEDKGVADAADGLLNYEIIDLIESKSIPKSLTGKRGSADRGETLMVDRKKGNCVACHSLDIFSEKAIKDPNKYGDMGEIGPPLDGVASRYKEGQLRLLLVNAKKVFPETVMPAFYRIDGLTRVNEKFHNKPILEAQDIEDIVSFLMRLK